MSMPQCKQFLEKYRSTAPLDDENDRNVLPDVCACARKWSGWPGIRLVLVEPMGDTPLPEWESATRVYADQHAVSLFMIISTKNSWFYDHRPYQSELDTLTSMFGKEPRWMRDATEKKDFRMYGIEL